MEKEITEPMKTLVAAMFAVTTSAWSLQLKQAEAPVANVRIHVLTNFGQPAGRAVVTLKGASHSSYRQIGESVSFDELPFGQYDAEIQASGFNTRRIRLEIYQHNLDISLGLALAQPHSVERSEIAGRIMGANEAVSLLVRLVPWYSDEYFQDKVNDDGSFRIVGAEPGRYTLMIFDESHLRGTKQIDFQGGALTVRIAIN